MKNFRLIILALVFLVTGQVYAASGIAYHGRILRPDGQPVEGNNVGFRIRILTDDGTDCLMYEEIRTKNLTGSLGTFSIIIGDGSVTGSYNVSGVGIFDELFQNDKTFNFTAPISCVGAPYLPATRAGRKLQVSFRETAMAAWEDMPVSTIANVPFAYSSIVSKKVGEFDSSNLLRVENAGVPGAANSLTSANMSELMALLGGTTTQYIKSVAGTAGEVSVSTSSGAATVSLSNVASVTAGTYGSATQVPVFTVDAKGRVTGVSNTTISGVGTGITDLTGDVTASGNGSVVATIANDAVTTAKILNANVTDAKLAADSVTTIKILDGNVTLNKLAADSVNSAKIVDGSITGSDVSGTAALSIASVAATGNVGAGTMTTRSLGLYELPGNGTDSVTLQAPAALAGSTTYILPSSDGGLNQVLKTDGAGNLSWQNDATGGAPVDASYTAKGIVQFDTNAATSGITVASGIAKIATGGVSTGMIADDAVSFAKLQNIATNKLLGRGTALSGDVEEITLGTGLVFSGTTLNATVTDSFAALPCGDGYIPYKAAGVWTCKQVASANTNDAIVSRDSSGNFIAGTGQFSTSVKITDGAAGGQVTIAAPGTFTSYNLTLPTDDGAPNQVLQTNGSGILSWIGLPSVTGMIVDGGNTTGSEITIGTNDSNKLSFETNNTKAMTVDTSGKVGIGTTAPLSKFHLVGSATGTDFLSLFAQNGITPESSATLGIAANKAVMVQGDNGAFFVGRDITNDIEFAMGTSVVGEAFSGSSTNHKYSLRTNATNRLTIDTNGNIGIGTTTPTNGKLEVNGSIVMSGSTSGFSGFQVPAVAGSTVYTLPAADGSANQVLKTNGSGVLAWVNDATGAAPGDASYAGKGVVQFDTDAATSGITVAAGIAKLANSGVVAATYGAAATVPVLTVDAFGRVTGVTNTAIALNASAITAGTLPIARGGTNSATALNNNRMMVSSGGAIVEAAALTNGQLLIGSTGAAPVAASLTAGAGITITPSAGGISIANSMSAPGDASYAAKGIVQFDTDLATSGITVASGVAKIGTGGVSTGMIAADAVTFPKMQNIATNKLLGRGTAATGDIEEITLGTGLSLTGTTLNSSGLAAVTNTANLANTKIWIGDAGGKAQEFALSGDATMTAGGLVTVDATSANTVNKIVKRDASGNFVAGTGQFSTAVKITDGAAGGQVTIAAPAAFTSYNLTLPVDDGGVDQVLKTNGSGILSWVNQPTVTGMIVDGGNATGSEITIGTNDSNKLSFETNNSKAMTIDTSGKVGIGTTAPTASLVVGDDAAIGSVGKNIVIGNTDNTATPALYMGESTNSFAKLAWSNSAASTYQNQFKITTKTGGTTSNALTIQGVSGGSPKIGFITATPSYDLSIDGNINRTLALERRSTGGRDFTIMSGGGGLGATDASGGDLLLASGISTGNTSSNIYLQTATAGVSGSADNAPTTKMTILGSGNVGIGTATPGKSLHVAGTGLFGDTSTTAAGTRILQIYAGNASNANSGIDITRGAAGTYGTASSNFAIRLKSDGGGNYRGAIGFSDTNSPNETMTFSDGGGGRIGIGVTAPTAALHLKAGTATAGMGPLKFTSGTNLTTPENGVMEYDGTSYYLTSGGTRRTIAFTGGAGGGGGVSTTSQTFNSDSDNSGSDGGFNFQRDGNNLLTISNAGDIVASSTTGSTSSTTGAFKVAGGMGVAEKIFAGSDITTGGVFSAPLGSVGAPSYTFTGDANTGAWSPLADTYALSTNGAERLRIDALGNVGIGTTSPAEAMHIYGTGQTVARVESSSDSSGSMIKLIRSRASGAALVDADFIGALKFQGMTSGGTTPVAAAIESFVEGAPLASKIPGRLVFSTTNAAGTTAEKMRIDSSGKVGIGTVAPAAKLHVSGGEAWSAYSNATMALGYGTDGTYPHFIHTRHRGTSLVGNAIDFYTSDMTLNGVFPTNAVHGLSIENGKLGVGTTMPSAGLDIYAGDIGILVGADNTARTRTDATIKYSRIAAPHYTNAALPVAMMMAQSNATENIVSIGGGSASMNTATSVQFFTAANNTSAVGTERMRIDSAGNVGIGAVSPGSKLHVQGDLNINGPIKYNNADFIYLEPALRNVSIGQLTPTAATGGTNVAVGDLSLRETTTGNQNTAMGVYSMSTGVDGVSNVAIGDRTLGGGGTTGVTGGFVANVAIGSRAMRNANGATYNVAIGRDAGGGGAGTGGLSGTRNIIIGPQTGANVTTGSYNILIGNNINPPTTGGSNQLTIGNLIYGTGVDGTGTTVSTGSVGIGTNAPSERLTVNGNILATAFLYSSDRRLKKDILPLNDELNKILSLTPVRYHWKAPMNPEMEREQIGLIAQEVQKVYPQSVHVDKKGWLRLDYPSLISPLIQAVKQIFAGQIELRNENEKLKAKNAELERRLEKIERLLGSVPENQ